MDKRHTYGLLGNVESDVFHGEVGALWAMGTFMLGGGGLLPFKSSNFWVYAAGASW